MTETFRCGSVAAGDLEKRINQERSGFRKHCFGDSLAKKSSKILVLIAHYATLLNRRVLISLAPKSAEGMAMGSDNLKNIRM